MGLVYVIGPGEPCQPYRVKIGYTEGNVIHRLRNLQVGSPFRLEILCTIQAGNAERLEEALHGELAEYNIHGEWFELPGDPVVTVKTAVAEVKATAGRKGGADPWK